MVTDGQSYSCKGENLQINQVWISVPLSGRLLKHLGSFCHGGLGLELLGNSLLPSEMICKVAHCFYI